MAVNVQRKIQNAFIEGNFLERERQYLFEFFPIYHRQLSILPTKTNKKKVVTVFEENDKIFQSQEL